MEPPRPSLPRRRPGLIARVLERLRCRRRSHQLVLFVTADDFFRMAGSVLRDRQQAQELFEEWHALVGPRRQWGSEEVPSVAVDVDGVDVPDR